MDFLEVELRFYTVAILKFSHQFFGAESPNVFAFVPSEATQENINRWGMIVRRQEDTLVLLVSSDRVEGFFETLSQEDALTFDFYVYASDALLAQYTEMPFDKRGKILYFSNENKKIEKNQLGKIHGNMQPQKYFVRLHSQPTIQTEDWITYKTGSFVSYEKNALLEIKNEGKKTVFSQKTTAEMPNTLINLTDLSEGKYSFEVNGKSTENFVYIAPAHAGRALALVKIVVDEAWKKDMLNSFSQEKNDVYRFFEMSFAIRNIFWRYYIIPRYETALQNTMVETQNKLFQFGEPQEKTMKNGQIAWVFEGKQAIPFQKTNLHSFQILRKKDHKGNPIQLVLRQLPSPTVDMIVPDSREKDAKVFAEMVVYL